MPDSTRRPVPKMNTGNNMTSNKAPRRSRTGCITCKIRRVKCDETRPECQRCTSTGRTCDGYPAAGVPSQHSTRRALATAVRQLQVVGPAGRVLGKPLPVDDVACFDFFRVCTASMTGSVFPGEKFWSVQMLQAAHAEPAVWKAAVALGALHRRWEFSNYCLKPKVTRRPGPQRDNTDALQFTHQALRHYAASLSLAQSIGAPNTLAVLSVALGAAAHLAGRWADSQVHIRAGLRIIREMKTQLRPSDLDGAAQALERLDAQAMTLSDATSPYEYTMSALEESRQMLLGNLNHRELAIDQNLNALLGPVNDLGQAALAIFRLMRQFFIIADAVTTGKMSPREFEHARLQMVEVTSGWQEQLTLLINIHESKSKFASDRELNRRDQKVLILSLRLYQTTVEVLLLAHGTPPEPFPDMSDHVTQQEFDLMSVDPEPTNIPCGSDHAERDLEKESGGKSSVGSGFPTISLTVQSKGHAALDSHLRVDPPPGTLCTDGFLLPAWATAEPSLLSSLPSAGGVRHSNENTNHHYFSSGSGCGSGSRLDTNLGLPGFCANPGYLSSRSSSSRTRMSPNTANRASTSNFPPQIQPKAPLRPSSPSPVLAPSRSPSPGQHEHEQQPEPSSPDSPEIQIPTSETRWDALHAHFDLIVDLASQIASNTESPLPFFMSLEPGLAMPLYLTVKRCRHPVTRRRALGLLRRLNRQEGIWNCALAARAAEEVIILEEEGLIRSWSASAAATAAASATDESDELWGRSDGGSTQSQMEEEGPTGPRKTQTGLLLLPLDIFEHEFLADGGGTDGENETIKALLEHYRLAAMEMATTTAATSSSNLGSSSTSTRSRPDGRPRHARKDLFWGDGWPNIPEDKRILVQYPIFKLEKNQLELLMFVMGDMGDGDGDDNGAGRNRDGDGGEDRGVRMAKRVIVDLF